MYKFATVIIRNCINNGVSRKSSPRVGKQKKQNMPSINDMFNDIEAAKAKLDQLHSDNITLNNSVNTLNTTLVQGFNNLSAGLAAIINLMKFADDALLINDMQNQTIICDLEKISHNTCSILNEAHIQTNHQEAIDNNLSLLEKMFETVHPDSILALQRLPDIQ